MRRLNVGRVVVLNNPPTTWLTRQSRTMHPRNMDAILLRLVLRRMGSMVAVTSHAGSGWTGGGDESGRGVVWRGRSQQRS